MRISEEHMRALKQLAAARCGWLMLEQYATAPHLRFNPAAARDAVLRVLPDAQLIYLFGSHARGDARQTLNAAATFYGTPNGGT